MNWHRTARLLILIIFMMLIAFYIFKPSEPHSSKTPSQKHSHIIDKAGVIPVQDIRRFEEYTDRIMRESGVDMRFIFVPDTNGQLIETMSANLMDQLQIGGRTGQERGVLLLYDMNKQRLRIEVGYGLEALFPDTFVNYLVEDHARMFFSSGDISLGLRLMLRLLQQHIRDAVIGNSFDPRTYEKMRPLSHMSGGAGTTTTMNSEEESNTSAEITPLDPFDYPAGETPRDTYYTYINWLSNWPVPPYADMFTPESRHYLKSIRISPAYAEFILLAEDGKRFEIVERGDVALLYFTDTPFVSPHFFVRENNHWRMDITAEIRNTREHVGGEYTWSYSGIDDKYTQAFSDLLIKNKGFIRMRDGDNRPLTIRGSD